MKKLLSILSLLFIIQIAYSQGNSLIFNQILLVDVLDTVPTGKVWKITSILPSDRLSSAYCNSSSSCGSIATQQIIKVNGSNVYMASSDAKAVAGYYLANASAAVLNNDIWLPEGSTLQSSTGVLSISVIEFLVVPN